MKKDVRLDEPLDEDNAWEELARIRVRIEMTSSIKYKSLKAHPLEDVPQVMLDANETLRESGYFMCDDTVPKGLGSTFWTAAHANVVSQDAEAMLILQRRGFIFDRAPMNPSDCEPAPWEIRAYRGGDDSTLYDLRAADWAKIYAANGELVVGDIDISTPEGIANELLIEQAPRLLRVLKQHLSFLNGGPENVTQLKVDTDMVLQRIEGKI